MKRGLMRIIASACAFEVGWTGAVLLASRGAPALGAVVAAMVGGFQIWLRGPGRRLAEARFVLGASVVGVVADAGLMLGGVLRFYDGRGASPEFLIWIFALWINFASMINTCLRWLRRRWWLSAALGAIAGPLTYYGGAKLGAVTLSSPPTVSLLAVAVEYAVLVPVMVWAAERYADRPHAGGMGQASVIEGVRA